MEHVKVGKWGDALAVCLPGDVVQALELQDGEELDISATDGAIVIRRAEPLLGLDELFAGKTPDE